MTTMHLRAMPVTERTWPLDSVYAVGYGGGRRLPHTPGPDSSDYRDTGCDIAPHCLDCPLPRCRYDLPPKLAGALMREAELRRLLAEGKTIGQAAVLLRVSRRTVFRLKRYAALAALVPVFKSERTRP